MALPTLDAVFASAADQPRRMMLAKWLVEEKGETQAPSSVLVSGAGSEEVNGIYTERGTFFGKPYYNLVGEDSDTDILVIRFDNEQWRILIEDGIYLSNSDTEFPWQATEWQPQEGAEPVPTVTEVPALNPIANYLTLPERYLWAKIAVAAGALKTEADYISLPKQYVWKAIYDAVSGSSLGTIDWSEKQALGHIAAAYRGDTANPANLATYIDWPWRYQVASIITAETTDADVLAFASISGATDIGPLDTFVKETKDLGYWDDMVFWPMKSAQNAGTGTTLYSLGGLGTFNGTLVNGPTWDTEGILFGASSGKRIDLPASSDLATGTGNYTFEQWVKVSSNEQFAFWETNPIGTSGTRANGWILYYDTSSDKIGFYFNGTNIIYENFALPLNEWFHFALVRNGSTTTIYKNGTSVGSTNTTYNSTAASGGSNFGTFCDSTSLSPDGIIGSSFFYKGIAKYTSNFMPPTML